MSKFIIIDHSFSSLQGHHYECSISIAEAATRQGYEAIIIANKALPQSLTMGDIEIIRAFEVDWFNNPVNIQDQSIGNLPQSADLKISQDNHQHRPWQPSSPEVKLFFEKVHGSSQRLKQWIKADIRSIKSIPLTNTIWGLLKIVWGVIRFAIRLIIKTAHRLLKQVSPPPEKPVVKIQSFTETLAEILPSLKLTVEDQVLIHTFGIEQLEELFYFLQNQDHRNLPTYHLLFRRDTEDPLVINALGMGLRKCLERFYDNQLWPDKIRFYTDTSDLVRKYNQLSPATFTQVPIPFRQEKLALKESEDKKDYIHIVYLGDARSEKGYQHLPSLVADLWGDYLKPQRARFTIQSNYNVAGGEEIILEAKLKLSQYPSSAVELIDYPLDPDEYYRLLASADVVVLPYNAQNYQRTSGVLTEALAAGKPVVVPKGSWLAEQVDDSRASIYQDPEELPQSVRRLLEDLPGFSERAQKFSLHWRSIQSPDYFVECLLKPLTISLPRALMAEESKQVIPSVLMMMEIDKLFHTSNIEKIRYFCRCGYEVYGIFYSPLNKSSPLDIDGIKSDLQYFGLKQYWIVNDSSQAINPVNLASDHHRQYLQDCYEAEFTLVKKWVEANSLSSSQDLATKLAGSIDLVYADSLLCKPYLDNLGLSLTTTLLEVPELYSYSYALQQKREVIPDEFEWEIKQLNSFPVLLTANEPLAFKLKELQVQAEVYSLHDSDYQKNINYDQLNKAIEAILGEKTLTRTGRITSAKIAMLYPWGDIQERCSGASQRSGKVVDFLASQGSDITVFTLGAPRSGSLRDRRSNWHNQIHYRYFQSEFTQGELVKKVYQNAFQGWQSALALNIAESPQFSTLTTKELEEHWLPWIYYAFRFDAGFKQWLEDITDWADVVLLEYPFWAAIAGPICRRKGVKLILTAHDVLAKQLPEGSWLGQVALAEELQGLKEADEVVTLSPDDQTFFQNYGITNHCVPIGLDMGSYENSLDSATALAELQSLDTTIDWRKPYCLFVGSQHTPNIEAVNKIKALAQTNNNDQWQAIAVGGCASPCQTRNFFALGKVSHSVLQALYQRAAIVLIPLEAGTGMSVKTLEAMAYGKVILGTAIAFRGYPVESGIHCLINDNLEDYGRQIEEIIQRPQDYQALGKTAKAFAHNYDYHRLYKTYLDLLP